MKVQFWGLSKIRINKLIKKLELKFQKELDDIENDLMRFQKENRKLSIQLENFSKKNAIFLEDQALWNLAQVRLEKVKSYLTQQMENEMALLHKKYAEKNSEITQGINKLNREREVIEQSFSQMLNQIAAIVEQSNVTVGSLDLINQQNAEKDNMPIEESEAIELVASDREISYIQSNTNEIVDEVYDESDVLHGEETTADKVQSELTVTEKNSAVMNNEEDNHQDSFWGNLEDWTETNHDLRNGLLDNHDMFTSIDTEFSENILQDIAAESSPNQLTKEQAVNKNEISKPVEEHSVENEIINDDLIEQIDAIKSQYIVGKMTGEDLLDAEGKLIISKYTLITREVVEKANRAGKLAELIVNMKLSVLGDD